MLLLVAEASLAKLTENSMKFELIVIVVITSHVGYNNNNIV